MTGIASPTAYVTGLVLGASLIIAIGAQNAFVLRQGLLRAHVALVVALCILIDVVLTAVGVGGLSAALGRSPLALDAPAHASRSQPLPRPAHSRRAAYCCRRSPYPFSIPTSISTPCCSEDRWAYSSRPRCGRH